MFACIFIPNFPVAAVLRAEPELRSQAVAIFEGKPPLEKVFAVNDSAKHLGISSGMTKAQAELCSELTLRPRSTLQESTTHSVLLDCAQSFSPCVENSAADTAILGLAGMEPLFGSSSEIIQKISQHTFDLGLDANVAVASNPDTAVLAARGFSGVTVIPPGKEAKQLGSLPIEVLFVGHREEEQEGKEKQNTTELLETFERWGIRNLHALAALPEIALSERLGQEGLLLQALSRGTTSRTLVPVEEPTIFEEAIELDHAVVLLEPLAFLMNRLLEQVCARLSSRALNTQQLRLTLELEHFSAFHRHPHPQSVIGNRQSTIPFHRTLNLPLPMLDPKLFLKLLQLDLNAHPPGAPILKIRLAAEPARPRSAQGGLFLPPSPEPEKLELTLARIAGLVGKARVGSLELLDSHRTGAFCMKHFMPEADQENRRKKHSNSSAEKSAVVALRIFRPPLKAQVTVENGEPMRVVCPKKKESQGDVLWKAGPWRSSGGWWERDAWSRDEWDIALQNSEDVVLYRLVQDLLSGGWFVEGTYD